MAKKNNFKLITKRQLQLYKYASKDETRTGLTVIHFDGDKASVTDGHKLIQCTSTKPFDPGEYPETNILHAPDKSFSINKDDAQTALGFLPKKCDIPIVQNCVAIGEDKSATHGAVFQIQANIPALRTTFPKQKGNFPKVDKLVEDHKDKKKVKIGISARYMKEICEYILQGKRGNYNDSIILEIEVEDSDKNPIRITHDEGDHFIEAHIMPVRI